MSSDEEEAPRDVCETDVIAFVNKRKTLLEFQERKIRRLKANVETLKKNDETNHYLLEQIVDLKQKAKEVDKRFAKVSAHAADWRQNFYECLRRQNKKFCVVCITADANMSFVHGNTAHLACCDACAKKFKGCLPLPRNDSDTEDDDEELEGIFG